MAYVVSPNRGGPIPTPEIAKLRNRSVYIWNAYAGVCLVLGTAEGRPQCELPDAPSRRQGHVPGRDRGPMCHPSTVAGRSRTRAPTQNSFGETAGGHRRTGPVFHGYSLEDPLVEGHPSVETSHRRLFHAAVRERPRTTPAGPTPGVHSRRTKSDTIGGLKGGTGGSAG